MVHIQYPFGASVQACIVSCQPNNIRRYLSDEQGWPAVIAHRVYADVEMADGLRLCQSCLLLVAVAGPTM